MPLTYSCSDCPETFDVIQDAYAHNASEHGGLAQMPKKFISQLEAQTGANTRIDILCRACASLIRYDEISGAWFHVGDDSPACVQP